MIYGSVCSGIEAATVAWHPLGWRCAFASEIEPFPRAVLKHRWPGIPLHGDFTTIQAGDYDPIELLVGGTPCQSFSVAGLRGGLDDDRGNLALEYLRLADRLRPRWLVWENVPGVLSSSGGRDFGAILGGMVELGYGFAYRVLDAAYFGVPQRRERVFVIGHLGSWQRAAAVLFERDSLTGRPGPRLPEALSVCITRRGPGSLDDRETYIVEGSRPRHMTPLEMERCFGFPDDYTAIPLEVLRRVRREQAAGRVSSPAHGADGPSLVVQELLQHEGEGEPHQDVQLRAEGALESGHALSAHTGRRGGDAGGTSREVRHLREAAGSPAHRPLSHHGEGEGHSLSPLQYQAPRDRGRGVRRGCESVSGPIVADGPRYKALGNSMAVPVMAWLGRRIQSVEALSHREAA